MTLRTIGDRILVERDEAETITPGGILIHAAVQEKPLNVTVLAVGEGYRNDKGKVTPLLVNVGDRLLIAKGAGIELKHDGKEYTVIRESEVLGVLG